MTCCLPQCNEVGLGRNGYEDVRVISLSLDRVNRFGEFYVTKDDLGREIERLRSDHSLSCIKR